MRNWILVTDRGGHLHNALRLAEQVGEAPQAIVTTNGPDIDALRVKHGEVYAVPYLFSWAGKTRFWNPLGFLAQALASLRLVLKLRPRVVVSVGASNVVLFCYWARLFGAKVIHVECMNQVVTASVTAKLLYPIASEVYVQWPELLPVFGKKARYEGWVL